MPTGQLNERQALCFAAVLGMTAMAILSFLVNLLTAALTFVSLIGYAVVYGLAEARDIPEHRDWVRQGRASRVGLGA